MPSHTSVRCTAVYSSTLFDGAPKKADHYCKSSPKIQSTPASLKSSNAKAIKASAKAIPKRSSSQSKSIKFGVGF
jgi:hypothetical protein